MIIDRFKDEDLDELMLFLDENITENYEKNVFLTIMNRWPEGFWLSEGKIVLLEYLVEQFNQILN